MDVLGDKRRKKKIFSKYRDYREKYFYYRNMLINLKKIEHFETSPLRCY